MHQKAACSFSWSATRGQQHQTTGSNKVRVITADYYCLRVHKAIKLDIKCVWSFKEASWLHVLSVGYLHMEAFML